MSVTELASLGLDLAKEGAVELFRGKGCFKCRGTGYLGRGGIYEVLPITETIKKEIIAEADSGAIRDIARREGMVTLRENAINKLLQGITTYQEVLRVTWEQF
jgi:general secretion pathway protein E